MRGSVIILAYIVFRSPLQRLIAILAVLLIVLGLSWNFLAGLLSGVGLRATAFDWPAQVSHWAGNGARAPADGPRLQAAFADPWGIVRDKAGNVYVADGGEANRIRKIAPDGSVTTLAGGAEWFDDGAGSAAAFHTPSGLAIDADGNLYVADTGNHAIRKLTPQGVVTTLAGNGQPGERDGQGKEAQFNGPLAVAVDKEGMVWVADTYNDRIRRIDRAGNVTTVAGATPGLQDGSSTEARFDTPVALAVLPDGGIAVADMMNAAIRRVGKDGQVTTLARGDLEDKAALLRRPLALAATPDGHLYIADGARGRLLQRAPDGRLRGLTGVGIDFAVLDSSVQRFARPAGIALDADGALLVTDALAHSLRRVEKKDAAPIVPAPAPQFAAPPARLPWPVNPNSSHHEIVGTVGEVRGDYNGEARHHFHAGLDVQAALGAPVTAIQSEKVLAVQPNWGEGTLNEGMFIDSVGYIHMKVGRAEDERPLDPARFIITPGADGKPRVRVRRGTRFAAGDLLGSVNRMYHVHLETMQAGISLNPIALPFSSKDDSVAPVIESVWLQDAQGRRLPAGANGAVVLPRDAALAIVADAWDRMDKTLARRKLGLYQLGYQLLRADGTPAPGFEQPRITQRYDRLPPDREAVQLAYADSSGITVYGNKETRFLYQVTNTLLDGVAKPGSFSTQGLAPGSYLLRILAADYAGNVAQTGRDLRVELR